MAGRPPSLVPLPRPRAQSPIKDPILSVSHRGTVVGGRPAGVRNAEPPISGAGLPALPQPETGPDSIVSSNEQLEGTQ